MNNLIFFLNFIYWSDIDLVYYYIHLYYMLGKNKPIASLK